MAVTNIEQLLKERFQARLALAKASTEEERLALMSTIADLTTKIEKIRPKQS